MNAHNLRVLVLLLVGSCLLASCGGGDPESTAAKQEASLKVNSANLVGNGSFTIGLEGWNVDTPKGVEISSVSDEGFDDNASMKLIADGGNLESSAIAIQPVAVLPDRDGGADYSLTLQAMTDELSRPVLVELRVVYTDGDYEFFSGGPEGLTTGIPEGTSNGWIPITVRAIARKEIESIEVFALDSGTEELSGSVWVDAVTLNESK